MYCIKNSLDSLVFIYDGDSCSSYPEKLHICTFIHSDYLSSEVSFAVINLSIVVYLCFLAKAFGSECLIEIGTPGPSLNIVCGCLSILKVINHCYQ